MKITILGKVIEIDDSLWRFAIVGGMGFLTNLSVFFITADLLLLEPNFCSVIAFAIAVTQNYIFNHLWSFKEHTNYGLNVRSYFQYVIVNILGLLVNLVILNLILIVFNPPMKVIAQFFGIIVGFVVDYIGSKMFVFKKRSVLEDETGAKN